MKTKSSAVLALALAFAGQDYVNTDLHYSLGLPPGWERIPQELLEHESASLPEKTGTPAQPFVAGFQRHAEGWLTYPYILILHRPAIGDTNLPTVAYKLREEAARANDHGDESVNRAGAGSAFGFDEPTVDTNRGLILVPTSQTVRGVGRVRGLMALKPGKEGTVQVAFYARADRFDEEKGAFDLVLNKMQFEPGHEWVELSDQDREERKNWADLVKTGFEILGGLLALVIAIVGGRLITRRKAPAAGLAAAAAAQRAQEVDMRGEEVLAVAEQLKLVEGSRSLGDLYFTSHRLVFVTTAERTNLAVLVFGLVGRDAAAAASRRASKELRSRPLGEIIARAEPEHVFEYSALDRVVANLYRVQTSTVVIEPRGGRRKKFYCRRKALLPLAEALARLQARGAPLQLSGA
jgi:hypothetical protein